MAREAVSNPELAEDGFVQKFVDSYVGKDVLCIFTLV